VLAAAKAWTADAYSGGPVAPAYVFSISEGIGGGDLKQRWQVTMTFSDTPPASPPSVDIPGYTTVLQSSSGNQFVFEYFLPNRLDEQWLVSGETIPQRIVTLTQLNILQQQAAIVSAYLQRNVNLVNGYSTANSFLYTTPVVQFSTPLRPAISIVDLINIATIDPNAPHTLTGQLTALFTALFQNAISGLQSIGVIVTYSYNLNASLAPVSLPVLLLPPTAYKVGGSDPVPLDLITQLTAGIEAWFEVNSPSSLNGQLQLNLKLFSSESLGAGLPPLPLLELANLYLNYSDFSNLLLARARLRRKKTAAKGRKTIKPKKVASKKQIILKGEKTSEVKLKRKRKLVRRVRAKSK
jgi:hypothetical protein